MSTQPIDHSTFTIETRRDHKRGCGWRQPGGLYMIGTNLSTACGRLPHPLTACPACGAGFHQSRGWRWIDPTPLFAGHPCSNPDNCPSACPMHEPSALPPSGFLWVGATYYPSPRIFIDETTRQGISKRIPHIPNAFRLGKTRIYLAHALAAWDPSLFATMPGIFASYVPTAIEYVVRHDDNPGKLENLQTKGATLIRIERIDPEPELPGITP